MIHYKTREYIRARRDYRRRTIRIKLFCESLYETWKPAVYIIIVQHVTSYIRNNNPRNITLDSEKLLKRIIIIIQYTYNINIAYYIGLTTFVAQFTRRFAHCKKPSLYYIIII